MEQWWHGGKSKAFGENSTSITNTTKKIARKSL